MKVRIAADMKAPARAREFINAGLGTIVGADGHPPGDDVVLIVSELVTNAVRAGAVRIDVEVVAAADRVDLLVSDDADGWPAPRTPAAEELGGRGLQILAALSDSWSATERRKGKTLRATWFRDPDRHPGVR